MSFSVSSLPPSVRTEYAKAKDLPILWPGVVLEAAKVGVKDEGVLTNIVFFLHHPERNGKAIGTGESKLVEEWKAYRTMVRGIVTGLTKPASKPPAAPADTPAPPAVDWVLEDTEAWAIQRDWGKDVADWVAIPPVDRAEAKEFAPTVSMKNDYKTVFVWKSAAPKTACVANPDQRVQLIAMVRDDLAYWLKCFDGNSIQAKTVQTAAETAIKDYRDYVVGRKMCPKSAYARLVQVNKDVIYEMIVGMYQLIGKKGPMGSTKPAATAAGLIVNKIVKYQKTGFIW